MPVEKFNSANVTRETIPGNSLTLENALADNDGQEYSEIAIASGSDSSSEKQKIIQLATSAMLRQDRLDKWQENEDDLPELEELDRNKIHFGENNNETREKDDKWQEDKDDLRELEEFDRNEIHCRENNNETTTEKDDIPESEEFDRNENHLAENNNETTETSEVKKRNLFSSSTDNKEIQLSLLRNRIARYTYYNKKKEKENEGKVNNSERNEHELPELEDFDRYKSYFGEYKNNNNTKTEKREVKKCQKSFSSFTDDEELQLVLLRNQVGRYSYYNKKNEKDNEEKMDNSERYQYQSEAYNNKTETEKKEGKKRRNSLSSSSDDEELLPLAHLRSQSSRYNCYNKKKGKQKGKIMKNYEKNQREPQAESNKNNKAPKSKDRKKKRRNSNSSSTDDEELQLSLLRSRIARYNYYNNNKENEKKMKNHDGNQQEPQAQSSKNYLSKNQEIKKILLKSQSSPLTLLSDDEDVPLILLGNRVARDNCYNKKKEYEEKMKNSERNYQEPQAYSNKYSPISSDDDDMPLSLLGNQVSQHGKCKKQDENLTDMKNSDKNQRDHNAESDKNDYKTKNKKHTKKRPNSSSSPLTLSSDDEPLSSRVPLHRQCKWKRQNKDGLEMENPDKDQQDRFDKNDNKRKSKKGRKKHRTSSSSSEDERVQLSLLNSRVARYRQPNSECSTSTYLYKHCSVTEINARKHFEDDGFFRYKPPFPNITEEPKRTKKKSVKFNLRPNIRVFEENVGRTPAFAKRLRGRRTRGWGRTGVRGRARGTGREITYTVKIKLVLTENHIEVVEEIEKIDEE